MTVGVMGMRTLAIKVHAVDMSAVDRWAGATQRSPKPCCLAYTPFPLLIIGSGNPLPAEVAATS